MKAIQERQVFDLKLSFVNVGYGESIVVQSGGSVVVIDGGPNRPEVYEQPGTMRLTEYLRREGIRRIDCMVITHIHEDHIAGLVPVVEEMEVGEIWCNVLPEGDVEGMLDCLKPSISTLSQRLYFAAWKSYAAIRRLAAARGIPMREMPGDGSCFRFGELSLTLLGMDAGAVADCRARLEEMLCERNLERLSRMFQKNDATCNQTSLAVKLDGGGLRALLTGDLVDGWDGLRARYDLTAEVLKVTHHGQRNGMSQAMLEGADPSVIVICADRDRTFNSAHPEIIGRAEQYLTERKRFPRIYITGRLFAGERLGSALEVEPGESCANPKTSIKLYA